MIPPRIYVDFNSLDIDGFRFNAYGTVRDIAALGLVLEEGMILRVSDGDLRGTIVVRATSDADLWRGELIDGPHDVQRPFAPNAFLVDDAGGLIVGLSSGLMWHPDPCLFALLATETTGRRNLYAATRVERRAYKRLERASRKGALGDMAPRNEIAELRSHLALPTTMLAFTTRLEGFPVRHAVAGPFAERVRHVLERGTPDEIEAWFDIPTRRWIDWYTVPTRGWQSQKSWVSTP
ncbi:hypothetical protein AB4059_07135 [Lysobacter sp. 2RAF19]